VSVHLELPVATTGHGDLMLPHLLVDVVEFILEYELTGRKVVT
jgi:hypothetical protein